MITDCSSSVLTMPIPAVKAGATPLQSEYLRREAIIPYNGGLYLMLASQETRILCVLHLSRLRSS